MLLDITRAQNRLSPDTELALSAHRRVVAQYATTPDGRPELILYYGDKEIFFDEPVTESAPARKR